MQHARTNRTRRLACVAGLALAATLALPLAGCSSTSSTSSSSTSAASSAAASSAEGTTRAASSAADGSAAADAFSYSQGLTDSGTWEGVTALDYVKLPADYAHITLDASDVAVSEDEIEEQVTSIGQSYATTSQVKDRAVADGDTVNIDFVGSIDGTEFSGGSTNGKGTNVTIGKTQYVDNFLDQLVGHTPGETFDVNVTFPDDYANSDVAGKDATFKTTINYISETSMPDITDDWVAQNLSSAYGWNSVADMREGIRQSLESSKVSSAVQTYLMQNSQVSEIPQVITDYQAGVLVAQYQSYADKMGTDLSTMLQQVAGVSSTEELIENNKDSIASAAKNYLVYQAVAEAAGITVTDDDVAAYFEQGMGVSDYSSYEQAYGMPYLKMVALVQKVNQLLETGATVDGEAAGSSAADAAHASSAKADAAGSKAESAAASSSSTDGEVRKAGASTASASSAHDAATSAGSARDASSASE